MTPELLQRLTALERANWIRRGAADLKRELLSGAVPFADAITDDRAASIHVGVLLMCQFSWGSWKAGQACKAAGVGKGRRVRELTGRQVDRLVADVELRNVNALNTHCKRGHELTPENTRLRANSARVCLECERSRRAS